jgi:hypothetical protein
VKKSTMLEKFRLLCWKNFTLQKRHPISAFFEIAFPILVVLIFAFAKDHLGEDQLPEQKFVSFSTPKYNGCSIYNQQVRLGVYAGSNERIADIVRDSVAKKSGWEFQSFGNVSDLELFLRENFTVGIEFSGNTDVSYQKLRK